MKTIETHQMRIKEKLGLRSAADVSKEASLWMSEVARRELAASRLGGKFSNRPRVRPGDCD